MPPTSRVQRRKRKHVNYFTFMLKVHRSCAAKTNIASMRDDDAAVSPAFVQELFACHAAEFSRSSSGLDGHLVDSGTMHSNRITNDNVLRYCKIAKSRKHTMSSYTIMCHHV